MTKQLNNDMEATKLHVINVKPLRTHAEIQEFKHALRATGKLRDVMLFTFGLNTGLRVSDILPLKVSDVAGKSSIRIKEKKTKKYRTVYLNPQLQEELTEYIQHLPKDGYLFPSQKGKNPLSATQAYRVLQKAAVLLEKDDVGTHTMRKTFGYMHYRMNKDVATLQTIFNHSSPEITLTYIGVTDEDIEQSQKGLYL